MKWSGENCTLIAQSGKAENHRITSQVSNLTYLGKHKDAEILLEQLEKENQTKNVFVEQYFLSNLATVQFALGKKKWTGILYSVRGSAAPDRSST